MAVNVEKLVAEIEVKTSKAAAELKKWKREVKALLSDFTSETIALNVDANTAKAKASIKAMDDDAPTITASVDLDGAGETVAGLGAVGKAADGAADQMADADREAGALSRSLKKAAFAGLGLGGALAGLRVAGKAMGITGLSKSVDSLAENMREATASNMALNHTLKQTMKSGLGALLTIQGLHNALDMATTATIKYALISTVGAAAVALLGVAVSGLVAELVALIAVLSAGLIAGLMGVMGLVMGLVGAVGVLGLAFMGLEDATDSAATALKGVLADIKEEFKKLGADLREALLPSLLYMADAFQTKLFPVLRDGLMSLTPVIGAVGEALADAFTSPASLRDLQTMFAAMPTFIADFGTIVIGVFDGMRTIITAALGPMQVMSGYFAELATRFANWGNLIVADGRLQEFLTVGIRGFKSLMEGVLQWGGALMQILRIAAPWGLRLMEVFQSAGEALNTWTKSTEGIASIASFFALMEPVVSSLGGFLKTLGGELLKLVMEVAPIMPPLIDALSSVIAPLGAAIAILAPVGAQLVQGLAPLVPLLLPIVVMFAELASTIGAALLPVIESLLTTIGPLLPLVTQLFEVFTFAGQIIGVLIEPLGQLISAVLPPLISLFTALSPVIVQVVSMLAAMVPVIAGPLINAFVQLVIALIPLLPVIAQLVVTLIPPLVQMFTTLAPVIIMVVNALVPLLVAIVQGVTPILAFVAGLLAMKVVLYPLIAIVAALGVVFAVMWIAALSPVYLVIGAIALLAGAFVLAYNNIGPFRTVVDAIGNFLTNTLWPALQKVADVVGGALLTGFNAVVPIVQKLWDIFKGLYIQPIIDGFNILKDLFSGDFKGALEGVGDLFSNFGKTLGKLGSLLLGVGKAILSGLWNGLQAAIPALFNFFISLPGKILGFLGNAAMWLLTKGWELLSGLLSGIVSAIPTIMGWFLSLPGLILGWIGDALSWLWQTGLSILSGLSNGLFNGLIAVTTFFLELPGKILGWIGDALSWLLEKGKDIITGLKNGFPIAVEKVRTWLTELPGKVKGWIGDALSWLVQKGKDIITGIRDGFPKAIHVVSDWLADLPGKVTGFIGDATGWLVDKGEDIIRGLGNGIGDMVDWLKEKVLEVAKAAIPDALEGFFGIDSPSKLMYAMGEYIGLGLVNGLLAQEDPLTKAAQGIARSVTGALTLDPTMTTSLRATTQANANGLLPGGAPALPPVAAEPAAPRGPAVVIQEATFVDQADLDVLNARIEWAVESGQF